MRWDALNRFASSSSKSVRPLTWRCTDATYHSAANGLSMAINSPDKETVDQACLRRSAKWFTKITSRRCPRCGSTELQAAQA